MSTACIKSCSTITTSNTSRTKKRLQVPAVVRHSPMWAQNKARLRMSAWKASWKMTTSGAFAISTRSCKLTVILATNCCMSWLTENRFLVRNPIQSISSNHLSKRNPTVSFWTSWKCHKRKKRATNTWTTFRTHRKQLTWWSCNRKVHLVKSRQTYPSPHL